MALTIEDDAAKLKNRNRERDILKFGDERNNIMMTIRKTLLQ
jgi:hypothetical protein